MQQFRCREHGAIGLWIVFLTLTLTGEAAQDFKPSLHRRLGQLFQIPLTSGEFSTTLLSKWGIEIVLKTRLPREAVDDTDEASDPLGRNETETEIELELGRPGKSSHWLTVLASKLFGEETAKAVKSIQKIISGFSDYGVVDVFSLYPNRDIVMSVLALSRLQHAAKYAQEHLPDLQSTTRTSHGHRKRRRWHWRHAHEPEEKPSFVPADENAGLLHDLARYAVFANAAYGWTLGLALSGRLHMGDLETLLTKTGIDRHDVVSAQWKSRTHRPAYFIVRDRKRKKVVLSIRGTLSAGDIITDLCCTSHNFDVIDDSDSSSVALETIRNTFRTQVGGKAHHGMLESAWGVAKSARKIIASELAMHPEFSLVIVGHSLGGGVAAILGSLWRNTFPGLTVYAYGAPCVGPLDACPTLDDHIVSVVGEGDPFSRLSLGHLADTSSAISRLCADEKLRTAILQKTRGRADGMSREDLLWSHSTFQNLQKEMDAEKFYPPGRIMYMGGSGSSGAEVKLKEVHRESFSDLILHPLMFDVSRHVPTRYESDLRRICSDQQRNPSEYV